MSAGASAERDGGRDGDGERDGDGGRDRDAGGRARNSRPRDGLGRPLDRTAVGVPTMPDELQLAPGEALTLAQQLIDDGRPFHAHEVFEAQWKSGPADQRPVWQGLAQVAVGLTHARRGNAKGAVSLLRRGANAISDYHGPPVADLDPKSVAQAAKDLADRIERDNLASLPEDSLRIRISPPPT